MGMRKHRYRYEASRVTDDQARFFLLILKGCLHTYTCVCVCVCVCVHAYLYVYIYKCARINFLDGMGGWGGGGAAVTHHWLAHVNLCHSVI